MALRGLAEALGSLASIERNPEANEAAARANREAIKIYDRAHDRFDSAWTQYSLGKTLQALAKVGMGRESPGAVEAFQAAQVIFDKETYPLFWASIQSEIAMSLATLGQHEAGTEKLRQAESILNEVLLVRSRDKMPTEWARTQIQLGQVFFELAEREPTSSYYANAITAAKSALEVLRPETNPTLWAQAQAALGTALSGKGEHQNSPDELVEAISVLRLGANDELREHDTGTWVKAQATLAVTLDQLGQLEWRQESFGGANWKAIDQSAQEHFEEAVAADRLGLEVANRQDYPLDWAYLHSKLAESLKTIGQRESDKSKLAAGTHLKEAVESGRAALEVMTIQNDPQNWADTQDTLGDALQALGKLLSSQSDLEYAISAYKESAKVQTFESDPANWAATQNSIGNVHQELGMLEANTAGDSHLQQAVESYRAALKVTTPESDLSDWMLTQREMARTETALGTREASTDHLQEAAAAYREELKYLSPDRSPNEWKDANEHLNEVLELLHRRRATG